MRKILVVVGILMATLTTQAQEKSQGLKGAWWATAQIGYQQTKTGDVKGTNTTILPLAGCFISPSVTVGAGVGMINIKADNATGTAANTSLIVVEPLVRKYWNVAGNLYFFGQLATPIISGKEKESNKIPAMTTVTDETTGEVLEMEPVAIKKETKPNIVTPYQIRTERFTRGLLEGKSASEAYRDAGYINSTKNANWTNASQKLRQPMVQAQLRAIASMEELKKEDIANRLIEEANTAPHSRDRIAALDRLGRAKAMFTDKVQHDIGDSIAIRWSTEPHTEAKK